MIRDAKDSSGGTFTLGIEGVHTVPIELQQRHKAHWDGVDMSIQIVGMTADAEICGLNWGEYHDGDLDALGCYNLNIRNRPGWRSPVWDYTPAGMLLFHGVGLLPDLTPGAGYAGQKWGFKIGDGCDMLIIAECPRLIDPITKELVRFWEHWGYFTNVMESYIVGNNIAGGNRTGFQDRTPGLPGYRHPTGPKLCADNVCNDYGWDWDFKNGGSAITYWESRGPLVIRGNEVIKPKYGALQIAHQPADQKPFTVSPEGHTHEDLHVEDNEFDSRGGDRSNASISSCLSARIQGNELHGDQWDLTINGSTASKWGAPKCEMVIVRGDHKIMDCHGDQCVPWAPGVG